ncbi:MAG: DegT/DnrJ/EryC1/StrS family aminotransferase [Acidobacteriota bacterium]
MTLRVPFMSLVPGPDAAAVRDAIDRVVARGWFILGPELTAFEDEFAKASGSSYAVGVGTGTDAIALTLRALGIGPGDEVITAPMSAAFSALAIMMTGATPVFADLDPERLTMAPAATESAITPRTAAILPVHLYGQPADMTAFAAIASRHKLALVEDACQAHLATSGGRPVGTFGAAGAFSFYPTKNLGALGDGGAITTNDRALADKLKRLRNGGQTGKYEHVEFGVNSRLDEIQAAILRARLGFLGAWTARRRELARLYRRLLSGAPVAVPPEFDPGHVYHLFPVLTPERDRFQSHLQDAGVGTLVHYPKSIPRQDALRHLANAPCPVADRVADEVCSIPLNPNLSDADVEVVAAAVQSWRPASMVR